MVKRCPECGLYTKKDGRIKEPYEECRLCGVVLPIETKADDYSGDE